MKIFLVLLFLILSLNRALSSSSQTSFVDSELHAKVAAGEAGGRNAPDTPAFLETMPKLRRKRNLLQSTENLVKDEVCPAECAKGQKGCKYKKTALLISIFLGVYGCDRFYLGYNLYGGLKIVSAILGFCFPLCHFYVFGFDAANNEGQKKKRRPMPMQRFCRCNNKKSRVPCFKVGNPFYCLTFSWLIFWYAYDIYHIANGTLVDQFNKNPRCYVK